VRRDLIFGLADRTVSLASGAGAMVRRIGYACVLNGIQGQTQLFLGNRLNLWLVTCRLISMRENRGEGQQLAVKAMQFHLQ
jgi:hypothetical protein